MNSNENFGNVLKRLRMDKHMSQLDVAKATGFSQQNISSWERGKRMPASDALLKLLKVYDVEDVLTEFGYPDNSSIDLYKPTDVEKDIILKLRQLPNQIRKSIITIIDYCYWNTIQKEDDEEILIAASGAENLTDEEREYNIELGKKYYELAHKDDK